MKQNQQPVAERAVCGRFAMAGLIDLTCTEQSTRNKKPGRVSWSVNELRLVTRAIDELQYPVPTLTKAANVRRLHSKILRLGGNRTRSAIEIMIRKMLDARTFVLRQCQRNWRLWFELAENCRRDLAKTCSNCGRVLLLMTPDVFAALDEMVERISIQHPNVTYAPAQPPSHLPTDGATMSNTVSEEVFTGEIDEDMAPPATTVPLESMQSNDHPANNADEDVIMKGQAGEHAAAQVGAAESTDHPQHTAGVANTDDVLVVTVNTA